MDNKSNVLYIFKYSAIDEKNRSIDDFFVAQSIDECTMFLDLLGYTNIQVRPLRIDEDKPDLNKKIDLDTVSIEFASLLNSLKTDNDMVKAVLSAAKQSKNNKSIYLRMTYFVYYGDSLSIAMRKLGDVIPNEIIEEVSLGEQTEDLINHLSVIVRKYARTKKKNSIFSKMFKKEENEYDIALRENMKDVRRATKEIVSNYNAGLYPFKYTAYDESGKKMVGYFNAESIDDCKKFLEIQGFNNFEFDLKNKYDIEITFTNKVSLSNLAFDLTQLSTYLKAGISLVDGVSILAKQSTSSVSRKAYQRLVYDLLKGDNLSTAMEHQGNAFPKLLINMIKSAEMTGDLTTILDDMADYYEDIEQTKKAMKSALTYPVFVLILAIAVLVFMLTVLVPQFVTLYQSNGAQLPAITLFIISLSDFFVHNYLYLILILLVIIVAFIVSYQNMPTFKRTVQTITMKLPGFGKIIIYNEIYNFTKTFASLLNHGVFITDSMEILSNITNNEIYKRIIYKTLYNLSKGENISESFKGEWAFPVVAYHMVVTGERTGQLGLMMEKVSEHYKQLHKSLVDQLKSLVEPIMILVVAFIVGVILLSIVTPMFDIYSQIR